MSKRVTLAVLIAILLVSGAAIVGAMRRTSPTFDEIVMVAGGARGYETGVWNLTTEHPPIVQYMYGLLPHLTKPTLPNDTVAAAGRYRYARDFYWNMGNDPERMSFLGRLPAVACALLLAFCAFWFTRRHYGDAAGLLAAALVAFMPDILAHGGVAYNDVPITLAIFAALWLFDATIRDPSIASGATFGLAAGLALGTKNSALTIAPIVLLLLVAEAIVRRGDRAWLKRIAQAAGVSIITMYAVLVIIYRGSFTLGEYRYSLSFVLNQVSQGVPSYLLGRRNLEGWWYYFPVSFVYKTSMGFHVLLLIAIVYFASQLRKTDGLARALRSPLRVPVAGVLVFSWLLVRSRLNIGFRYAMPVLPMLAVIAAVGAAHVWRTEGRRTRALIAVATVWLIGNVLSFYPNFLTYTSEYGPGRKKGYEVFADSSLDWGQGLLQLRDFMRDHNIPTVYLSYYGSGRPAGYGIDYIPLLSFMTLAPNPHPRQKQPEFIVISATSLAGGSYFSGMDPFRHFRDVEPVYVIGNLMYVYRVTQ